MLWRTTFVYLCHILWIFLISLYYPPGTACYKTGLWGLWEKIVITVFVLHNGAPMIVWGPRHNSNRNNSNVIPGSSNRYVLWHSRLCLGQRLNSILGEELHFVICAEFLFNLAKAGLLHSIPDNTLVCLNCISPMHHLAWETFDLDLHYG